MGANNVLDIIQYRHSNHRQLATLPVDLRPVADGLVQVEPSAGQRRTVQHQAIDVDQSPAACPSDLCDELRQLWMLFFVDQGYARHGLFLLTVSVLPTGWFGFLHIPSSGKYPFTRQRFIIPVQGIYEAPVTPGVALKQRPFITIGEGRRFLVSQLPLTPGRLPQLRVFD